MSTNHVAGFVLATAVWVGLGAAAILGGPTRPAGEFWTSTSSQKIASHPTLVRANYPTMPNARAGAGQAVVAFR
jgi:hypothetical protein